MTDSLAAEMYVTMAPVHPHPPREEQSGNASDLFACTTTGHFVTLPNFLVEIAARNVNTSKNFLCSSCLVAPLTIIPPHKRKTGLPFAKCSSCSWDTSHCSITSIADLIDQSTTPFPWLFSHFRVLKTAHQKELRGGDSSINFETVAEYRSEQRSRSLLRLHSASSTDAPQSHSDRNSNGNTPGAVFTETQSRHEQKVFQTYMPPSETRTAQGVARTQFLDLMEGELDSDALVKPGERRANGVWMRRQVGPRQRTRRPHVTVKSKLCGSTVTTKWDSAIYNENSKMEYTGVYVLPIMTMKISAPASSELNCSKHGKFVNVRVTLVNQRKFRMWAQIYNWVDREQSQEVTVDGRERAEVFFEGLKWSRENVKHLRWLHNVCERLVQLGVNVQYETPAESKNDDRAGQICGRVWQVCLFGRHPYNCKDEVLCRN